MFLRAEDRSKAQVISSDDDRSSSAVYAEHSPALDPRSTHSYLSLFTSTKLLCKDCISSVGPGLVVGYQA